MSLRITISVLLAFVLLLPTGARSYWGTYDVGNLASLDFSYRMSRIQMQIAERSGSSKPAKASALRTAERPAAGAAREFAKAYPAAERERAAEVFKTLLQKYAEIETRFGITHGDIGGALAAFVAGNLMAMRQQPFPDAHFATLVQQMRGQVAANAAFKRIDAAELRRTYEQLAIIGMFMAATQMALEQQPDTAMQTRTVAAARSYLGTLIPGDLDRLQVTATGLSLR